MPGPLSPEELLRYSRHLLLGEVAEPGQLRLKSARVLVTGVGGLGAPIAMYLAAAGVGRLGIVDDDVVEVSNLQRQVLFGTKDLGRPKVAAAAERLRDMNPHIEVDPFETRLTRDNAMQIVSDYDIVVDGTDNFATRYLINDTCVLQKKPNVYGSLFAFEGQTTVFSTPDGPCYRCLYPDPPPPGLIPNCAEGGVLGVLPGIIGSIQANETIKLILGKGNGLSGRLVLFDALGMTFRELAVPKNPECPACGEQPSIRELVDYEALCGNPAEPDAGIPEITASELSARLEGTNPPFMLDVREPYERQICHLDGHMIPLAQIPKRLEEIAGKEDIVVYCRAGIRSAAAVRYLQHEGFRNVWNLRGGILAWSDEVDSTVPKY